MSARLPDRPFVELPDRASWRRWLAENGESSDGIWLAVGKKGNGVSTLFYEDAVQEALCFGWIDSTVQRMDADRFKQLFTPRRPGSIWSAPNKERVARLKEAGLMAEPGRAAIERAKADGSWDLLTDVEALVMPDDLTAALDAEPAAAEGFSAYPDSMKKQVLWWIVSAKRPATRAERIARTIESAAKGETPR